MLLIALENLVIILHVGAILIVHSVRDLRRSGWDLIPTSPGVYCWFFPTTELDNLMVSQFTKIEDLRIFSARNGFKCLYHGLANNLRQRIEWHADQELTKSVLASGFLSTFRLSLLALNDFEYGSGNEIINEYLDELFVSWDVAKTRMDAAKRERERFQSGYHFPLNIQNNLSPELAKFHEFLKERRKSYKKMYR